MYLQYGFVEVAHSVHYINLTCINCRTFSAECFMVCVYKMLRMKKLFCLVFLLLCVLMAHISAQNTLTIHQKDGRLFSYGFLEKPIITYTETDLVLTTAHIVVEYPLSAISKFTFTETETSVSGVETDVVTPILELKDNTVHISGAKPLQTVTVIGADGKIISTFKTDASGSVTFSIASLPKGIYIVKSESLTCKISKR